MFFLCVLFFKFNCSSLLLKELFTFLIKGHFHIKFQTAYVTGLQAYNDGDWVEAAEMFEKSLDLYFEEEGRCRIGCERSFTHSGYPDFISAVAGL